MSIQYGVKPEVKIETGSTTIYDATRVEVVRPENNVGFAVVTVDDYKNRGYQTVFSTLNTLKIYFRYADVTSSWTQVFSGTITSTLPSLNKKGEMLQVSAWGHGLALVKTHCNTSYGKESLNPTVYTPDAIIEDVVSNYVDKSFGGAGSGWGLLKSVDGGATPEVTHLDCAYKSNFDVINIILDLYNSANATGKHWFVDVDNTIKVKTIGATAGTWYAYWRGSQAASTIEVEKQMILYDFSTHVEDYANHVILCSGLRKPGYDYWTEDSGGQALWGSAQINRSDHTTHIVGSHSLLLQPTGAGGAINAWYPAAQTADWNLTMFGSENTIPCLNMWLRKNKALGASNVHLHTGANDYFAEAVGLDHFIPVANEWAYVSYPVGPYHMVQQNEVAKRWVAFNNADWQHINYICFTMVADATMDLYIDDLHFSGKLIRRAFDSTLIAADNDWQVVIHNDNAWDDAMKVGDDSGTAARLAKAELMRRRLKPTVAQIRIPLSIDALPGQKTHVHAHKKADGTFRTDKDFRIKELTHVFELPNPYTIFNVTDEVAVSHGMGAPSAQSLLIQYAGPLGNAEAKNLKASGIDILINGFLKDYPS